LIVLGSIDFPEFVSPFSCLYKAYFVEIKTRIELGMFCAHKGDNSELPPVSARGETKVEARMDMG